MLAELLQQEGINLTVKAISKWETNATEPSVATFLAVCKVLNITNIYEIIENSRLFRLSKPKYNPNLCNNGRTNQLIANKRFGF